MRVLPLHLSRPSLIDKMSIMMETLESLRHGRTMNGLTYLSQRKPVAWILIARSVS
jgi:hypothetical protein